MKKLICWLFGCKPCYGLSHITPCSRCGAVDVSYADCVGDTRWNAIVYFVERYAVRWWLPRKCCECGKRYGNHDACTPF